jgi:RNA polymerase sigma-54 factor
VIEAQIPKSVPNCARVLWRICKQPLEMLAKRDFKRLAVAVNDSEAQVKLAMALIARLEPKPGRQVHRR